MSLVCPTRDALVAFINAAMTAGTLTPKITAVAAWEATAGLEKLTGGRLLVIPSKPSAEMLTYDGEDERRPEIDVIVQYKSDTTKTTELDPYVILGEAIGDLCLGATLSNSAQCIAVDWPDGAISHENMQDSQLLPPIAMSGFGNCPADTQRCKVRSPAGT